MRLEDVWFRYGTGGPWVLCGATGEAAPGGLTVVRGANGSGKSTLLKLLAGVLRPVRGRVADRPGPVGWVPERFPADQPFGVRTYLRHMAAVRGLRGAARDRAADHWIERLGLGPHRGTALPRLSKGNAQRVGIAQAMLVPPGLLILDEPWEGLDEAAGTLVPELVLTAAADGAVVLLSDHQGRSESLPGAATWTVDAGAVTATAGDDGERYVLEVGVVPHRAAALAARLRAEGHEVRPGRRERAGEPREAAA